jgi:hypothetical protein
MLGESVKPVPLQVYMATTGLPEASSGGVLLLKSLPVQNNLVFLSSFVTVTLHTLQAPIARYWAVFR